MKEKITLVVLGYLSLLKVEDWSSERLGKDISKLDTTLILLNPLSHKVVLAYFLRLLAFKGNGTAANLRPIIFNRKLVTFIDPNSGVS